MEVWRAIPEFDDLYEVSSLGNVRRATSRGICHHRLSGEAVEKIRSMRATGMAFRKIAPWFGVTEGAIRKVIGGKTHKAHHVPNVLKRHLRRDGYLFVALSKEGVVTQPAVHALVAAAFLGSRPNGHQINHRDGIKTNNALANLEYVTPRGNMAHARDVLGVCGKLSAGQVLEIRALRRIKTEKTLAAIYGVHQTTISNIMRRTTWPEHPSSEATG